MCVYPTKLYQAVHQSACFQDMIKTRLAILLLICIISAMPASIGQNTATAPRPSHAVSTTEPGRLSPPVAHKTPQQRKKALRKILAKREFAKSRISIWERLYKWCRGAVTRLMSWLFDQFDGRTPASLAVIVSILTVVAFLILLAYTLFRLNINIHRSKRAASDADELYAGPDDPKAALDEAELAAASGDFRTALRLVYLAVLLNLDERELIRFDRTGTNWEYYRSLRARKDIQKSLRPITVAFDWKWYGHQKATDADYRKFVNTYQEIASMEARQ